MKNKYRTIDTANNINQILKSTLKKNQFANLLSLTSNYSDRGGFEIYKSISRSSRTNYLGPLIKAHTTAVNINWSGTSSKITIKRINGISYHIQFGLSIIIIIVVFIISVQKFIKTGELLDFNIHVIPLFCILYMLLLELWAITEFKVLSRKIVSLIKNKGVEISKM